MEETKEGFWEGCPWWQCDQYHDKCKGNEITVNCDFSLESKEQWGSMCNRAPDWEPEGWISSQPGTGSVTGEGF